MSGAPRIPEPPAADATAPLGKRAAHKAATRAAISQAAAELFDAYGYSATTVAHIAAAAGVTERTFFRYFASKDELLLPGILEVARRMAETIEGRPDSEPPFEAIANALSEIGDIKPLTRLFSSGPPGLRGLRTYSADVMVQIEDVIATGLVERAPGASPAQRAFHASVIARSAIAAARSAAIFAWREGRTGTTATLELVFDALDLLDHAWRPPDQQG